MRLYSQKDSLLSYHVRKKLANLKENTKNFKWKSTWKTVSMAFPKSSKLDLGGGILCAKLKKQKLKLTLHSFLHQYYVLKNTKNTSAVDISSDAMKSDALFVKYLRWKAIKHLRRKATKNTPTQVITSFRPVDQKLHSYDSYPM